MRTARLLRYGLLAFLLSVINFPFSTLFAQGSAFTYQGRLTDSGSPANGNYDLRFTLYDAISGGTILGGPVTNTVVGVSNGLFTVVLDFGAGPFDGNSRWLDTAPAPTAPRLSLPPWLHGNNSRLRPMPSRPVI